MPDPRPSREPLGRQRVLELQRELAKKGCDGLAILSEGGGDVDLAPFVGEAHLGRAWFWIPARGPCQLGYFTDMERDEAAGTGWPSIGPTELGVTELARRCVPPGELHFEAVRRLVGDTGENGTAGQGRKLKVALAGHLPVGDASELADRARSSGWTLISGQAMLRSARRKKTQEEIREMSRIGRAVTSAFHSVARLLAAAQPAGSDGTLLLEGERLTVGRLRAAIGSVFAAAGLEQPEGNIVAPGPDSAIPHNRGRDDQAIDAGRTLVVDLFPRRRLFSDCTRTFCVGAPSAPARRAHHLVRDALEEAERALAAGASSLDLHGAVCDGFEAAGEVTCRSEPGTRRGFVHGLGHGVGYELHEAPWFRKVSEPLENQVMPGDVVTLEPGLYQPDSEDGAFGIRLENCYAVTDEGVRCLTPAPLDLDPRAWS